MPVTCTTRHQTFKTDVAFSSKSSYPSPKIVFNEYRSWVLLVVACKWAQSGTESLPGVQYLPDHIPVPVSPMIISKCQWLIGQQSRSTPQYFDHQRTGSSMGAMRKDVLIRNWLRPPDAPTWWKLYLVQWRLNVLRVHTSCQKLFLAEGMWHQGIEMAANPGVFLGRSLWDLVSQCTAQGLLVI